MFTNYLIYARAIYKQYAFITIFDISGNKFCDKSCSVYKKKIEEQTLYVWNELNPEYILGRQNANLFIRKYTTNKDLRNQEKRTTYER